QILARIELHPEEAGMPEDHDECVAHAPWQSTMREIDLCLLTRLRLEARDRLRGGPQVSDEIAQLRDTTGVAGGAAFGEQSRAAQAWILREARLDDRLEGLELRRLSLAGSIARANGL